MEFFNFRRDKIVLVIFVLSTIADCTSLTTFSCPTAPGDSLPYMPKTFSTDIRFNFPTQLYTIEAKHSVDTLNQREALELWSPKRHVKYIFSNRQSLLIKYQDESAPTCTVMSSTKIELDDKDAGPNRILQKIEEVTQRSSKFVTSSPVMENGIFMRKWEVCFKDPSINISMGFTETDWGHPRTSALFKDPKYLVHLEAQIWDDHVVAVFDNFNPTMPDDVEFQPPENVYCDGFRSDKKPPSIQDYFSYDAEIIVFESSEGLAPMVSHRKVFYDYRAKIARIDFFDPLAENEDTFSKITAQVVSIIHDFNSSVQYNIDPASGKCYLEDYIITVDVVEVKETKNSAMLTGQEFFSLDTRKISYNGQFVTRGHLADVYTALVPHLDGSAGKSLYTWYFSTDRTQIVENDKVEKNVLLRMVIQPEAAVGYQGRVDVNLYNFRKEEPTALVFDISSCYNESVSKKFVLTFPANDNLRGSEKFLKLFIHLALKDVTGLSRQRIFVSEVSFTSMYMFAEFKILDAPSVLKSKATTKEISLDEAISKIKQAISDQKLKVSVSSDERVIVLKPEPGGFNEFSGDRRQPSQSSYKEGSVIALTVGMLILGFVLGGITLNLIVSRKYGVSLFQSSNSGLNRFDNPLNESAM